jgi:hypothetical protein
MQTDLRGDRPSFTHVEGKSFMHRRQNPKQNLRRPFHATEAWLLLLLLLLLMMMMMFCNTP